MVLTACFLTAHTLIQTCSVVPQSHLPCRSKSSPGHCEARCCGPARTPWHPRAARRYKLRAFDLFMLNPFKKNKNYLHRHVPRANGAAFPARNRARQGCEAKGCRRATGEDREQDGQEAQGHYASHRCPLLPTYPVPNTYRYTHARTQT
jgi:hypothetical protein